VQARLALRLCRLLTCYRLLQVGVTPSNATAMLSDQQQRPAEQRRNHRRAARQRKCIFNTQASPEDLHAVCPYAGDNTNAGSQSQGIQLTVSSEASILKFNIDAYDAKTGKSDHIACVWIIVFAGIIPYGSTEGFGKGNPASGSVTLSQNGTQIATLPLNSEGGASYQFPASAFPTATTYTFTAVYSGDSSYMGSTASGSVTMGRRQQVT